MKKILILFFSITYLFPQESYTIITKRLISIQKNPWPSKVVMEVTIGDTIEIFPEFYYGFYKVSANDQTGWVSGRLINDVLPKELTTDEFKDKQNKQKREEDRKKKEEVRKKRTTERKERLTKRYGLSTANKIIAGKIWIGMSSSMARASLGNPYDINRSVYSFGVHEQWVYDKKGMYLYFEDGILTSWQE